MSSDQQRKFDVIVWGATGFTGKLVCEYIATKYPQLRWAVGGRSESKLCAVLSSLNVTKDVIVANLSDDTSMDALCSQTNVLISTAGPFAKLGTPVVAACIRSGTHYVDITGEGQWVRSIIDAYHEDAKSKQLKIIPCCGLDCLPSDMTHLLLTQQLKHLNCHAVNTVRLTVDSVKGGVSGGTVSSIYNMFENLSTEELLRTTDPYYLYPRATNSGPGPKGFSTKNPVLKPTSTSVHARARDVLMPAFDTKFIQAFHRIYDQEECHTPWGLTMPWVMQAINTRVVNRSIALAQSEDKCKDGCDTSALVYTEALQVPGTEGRHSEGPLRRLFNLFMGLIISFTYCCVMTPITVCVLYFPLTRRLFKLLVLDPIQSGAGGPSKEEMKKGYFNGISYGIGVRVKDSDLGKAGTDMQRAQEGPIEEVVVYGSVNIEGDAGYMKTAVMLTECALSLALNADKLPSEAHNYGIVTPAIGLGTTVVDRLNDKSNGSSGITFKVFNA